MSVEVFKNGKSILVSPHDLHNHLQSGYVLENKPESRENEPESSQDKENEGADLEAARDLYFEKFGEKPHHKMKLESILEKLNDSQPS